MNNYRGRNFDLPPLLNIAPAPAVPSPELQRTGAPAPYQAPLNERTPSPGYEARTELRAPLNDANPYARNIEPPRLYETGTPPASSPPFTSPPDGTPIQQTSPGGGGVCCQPVAICRLADQPSGSSMFSSPSQLLGRSSYNTGAGFSQDTSSLTAATAWETTSRIAQVATWLLGFEPTIKETAPAGNYYVLIFDRATAPAATIANGQVALHTYGPFTAGGSATFQSTELVELGGVAPFYGDSYDVGITAVLSTTPRVMTAPAADYLALFARIRTKP